MKKINAIVRLNMMRILKTKGLTQTDLAQKIQKTQSWISQVLSDKCNMRLSTVESFASALEVPVAELFQETGVDKCLVTVSFSELEKAFKNWCDSVTILAHDESNLTPYEAAITLGVPVATLVRYKEKGLLHPIKIGRKLFYKKQEVEKIYEIISTTNNKPLY